MTELTQSQGNDWLPPCPGPSMDAPSEETPYNRLNHVEKELLMLIAERPSEEKRAAKLSDEFESPVKSIKTMLGTLNCTRAKTYL